MKTNLSFFALVAALAGPCCFAQTSAPANSPASDSKPASSNVPSQQYPRIDSESRATFRVNAPSAQKVGVHVNRADYDMTKGEDGFWMVTTKPLEPGFHYYNQECLLRIPRHGARVANLAPKPEGIRPAPFSVVRLNPCAACETFRTSMSQTLQIQRLPTSIEILLAGRHFYHELGR